MFERLGAEDFCYLTTTGRASGNPPEIEIWFALADTTVYMLHGSGMSSDSVRNLLADVHGQKAAAWLLKPAKVHKSLRTFGRVHFQRPLGASEPRWFKLAILALKRRPQFWRVSSEVTVNGMRYRIMWVPWKRLPAVGTA